MTVITLLFLPESHGPTILAAKLKKARKDTDNEHFMGNENRTKGDAKFFFFIRNPAALENASTKSNSNRTFHLPCCHLCLCVSTIYDLFDCVLRTIWIRHWHTGANISWPGIWNDDRPICLRVLQRYSPGKTGSKTWSIET